MTAVGVLVLAEVSGAVEVALGAMAVVQTVLLAWIADGPRRARWGRERRQGERRRG